MKISEMLRSGAAPFPSLEIVPPMTGIRKEELPSMPALARKALGPLFNLDPSELSDADVLAILKASYR